MGSLYDAVRRVLSDSNVRYDVVESGSVLQFGYRTPISQWLCVVEVREEQAQVIISSLIPGRVERQYHAAMAELMTRINYGIAIGNFEMNYATGQVRFRTSIDLEGSDAAPSLLRQLLRANLSTVARYLNAIQAVAKGEREPQAALATVRASA